MTKEKLTALVLNYAQNKKGDLEEIVYKVNALDDPQGFLNELGLDFCQFANTFVQNSELGELITVHDALEAAAGRDKLKSTPVHKSTLDLLKKSGNIYKDHLLGMEVMGGPQAKVYNGFSEKATIITSQYTFNVLRKGAYGKLPALYQTRFAEGANPVHSTMPIHFFAWHRAPRDSHFQKFKGAYFGIEIEMRFKDRWKKAEFCNFVLDRTKQDWFGERDGSLEREGGAGECGVELVSKPSSISELESIAPVILKKAREWGGMGDAAGNFYGLHVNCNLPEKNPRETARRFICIVNNPKLRQFWELVARRKATHFCAFQDVRYDSCLETEADRHYRAVFVRPENTNCIEVRIFKSTINENTLLSTVELLDLTMQYSGLEKCDFIDTKDYLSFIISNASTRLKEYFKHCGVESLLSLSPVNQTLNFAE